MGQSIHLLIICGSLCARYLLTFNILYYTATYFSVWEVSCGIFLFLLVVFNPVGENYNQVLNQSVFSRFNHNALH